MVLSARQRTRVPSTSGLLELYAEGAIAAIVDVSTECGPSGSSQLARGPDSARELLR